MTASGSFSFDEIRTSPPITGYEVLHFQNSTGLKLAYFRFAVQHPAAKLIFIHGGGASSNLGYFNLAHDLQEKHGIETILLDLAGHGISEGNRGDCVSVESTYHDINDLARRVNPDNGPIFLGGHSSGAGFALNYSSWSKRLTFNGYLFISPEFGYTSKTEKAARVDFAKIRVFPFIVNAISGGALFGHAYAVTLNYPREVVEQYPQIVTRLTVNMANALTPQAPQRQIASIAQPFAIFIGEDDELFDPDKVIGYHQLNTRHPKSVSQKMKSLTHLSILLRVGDTIGKTIHAWLS